MNGNLFVSWYTAVRKVKSANTVTLAQDMIFPPLMALLFAIPGGDMIWLHLPAAGVLTGLLLFFTRRRSQTEPDGAVLAFSVERDAEKAGEASAAVSVFCEEQGFAVKQAMLLSMAIEELIVLMVEQNACGGDISVRIMRFEGGIVLRLRDAGRKFDPLDYYKSRLTDDIEDSVGLMGIKYITEAAEVVSYRETFGVNNLVVII
jgi:anti-sigma regulatory factor (Ser/Thr protein kinase)